MSNSCSYNLPPRYHENMDKNSDCVKAVILCGGPAKGKCNLSRFYFFLKQNDSFLLIELAHPR